MGAGIFRDGGEGVKSEARFLEEEPIRCPLCDNSDLEYVPSIEHNTFRCRNPDCKALFKIWRDDQEYEEHLQSITDEDEEVKP